MKRRSRIHFILLPSYFLLSSLSGCEVLTNVVTAPILIAEGAKEKIDRKQTEKQERHPYGRTDLDAPPPPLTGSL